jgi:hypothetical protein
VNCHGNPLVLVVHPANKLGQMRLDVTQRKHSHSQKYDQKLEHHQTAAVRHCDQLISPRLADTAATPFSRQPFVDAGSSLPWIRLANASTAGNAMSGRSRKMV